MSVDDGLLLQLSHQQMEGVRQARLDRDVARDELAGAGLARQRARDSVEIAKRERAVVRAEIDVSELRLEIASERGTLGEVAEAKASRAWLNARVAELGQVIVVGKLEGRQAQVAFELAAERVRLREAQVVMEKARALAGLSSAVVGDETVRRAESDVQVRYGRVQALQTRAQAAATEVKAAREHLGELESVSASLRPVSS